MTDDGWSSNDAKVVCRQLGYSTDGEIEMRSNLKFWHGSVSILICGHPGVQYFFNAYFGQGTGSIFLDNVACSGSETSLITCSYTTPTSSDYHSEDAGVRCPGQPYFY